MSIPVLIIPVLNRHDLLEIGLRSIDHPIDNILIINNDPYLKYDINIDGLNIHILNMPSNQGIAASWNLGIKCYPHSSYWVIGSADTFLKPGEMAKMEQFSGSEMFVKSNSHYSFFSVGENIISKVGLFDEYIYPAYYEDNDFDDRMVIAGFSNNIICPGIQTDDNGGSQTIKSNNNFMKINNETFNKNQEYYYSKNKSKNYTIKGWELIRRRENEWLK